MFREQLLLTIIPTGKGKKTNINVDLLSQCIFKIVHYRSKTLELLNFAGHDFLFFVHLGGKKLTEVADKNSSKVLIPYPPSRKK